MNLDHNMNEILNYIEKNLKNEIPYTALAQILGTNDYTM